MRDNKVKFNIETIILNYIPKEIVSTKDRIIGMLKEKNCTVNPTQTIADLKEQIGYLNALETIQDLPKRIEKENKNQDKQ